MRSVGVPGIGNAARVQVFSSSTQSSSVDDGHRGMGLCSRHGCRWRGALDRRKWGVALAIECGFGDAWGTCRAICAVETNT